MADVLNDNFIRESQNRHFRRKVDIDILINYLKI